ncbi:hypothetical protein HAX54_010653, partial [Datura stramonium]|nr:hypothetical protein [Datura stramonium]
IHRLLEPRAAGVVMASTFKRAMLWQGKYPAGLLTRVRRDQMEESRDKAMSGERS